MDNRQCGKPGIRPGIKASMQYYGIPVASGSFTAYFLPSPALLIVTSAQNYDTYSIPFDWNTYYNQATVKYDGNTNKGN